MSRRRDTLPPPNAQLENVKLKNPIEQEMIGHAGLFRQQNIERRKFMSVREWAEFCAKDELRAPSVRELDLHARSTITTRTKPRRGGRRKARDSETAEPEITPNVMVKEEQEDEDHEGVSIARVIEDEPGRKSLASPPNSADTPATPVGDEVSSHDSVSSALDMRGTDVDTLSSETPRASASAPRTLPAEGAKEIPVEVKPKAKGRRNANSREAREAALAERAAKDASFLESFNPHADWLPPDTKSEDYTPEFCKELERRYWRYCGLGKSAWYGADMAGTY